MLLMDLASTILFFCLYAVSHNIVLAVTLGLVLAVAQIGWQVVEWNGAVSGSAAPINITMDADKSVGALFKQLFTVTCTASAQGSITPAPPQLSLLSGTVCTSTPTLRSTQVADFRAAGPEGPH